jgi:hypothetical protein
MPAIHDEAEIRQGLNSHGIPEHMHDGIVRYLLYGLPPGSFYMAVLTNDLCAAVGRADVENRIALADHVRFLYNCVPASAWGSQERVDKWMAIRRQAAVSA